MTKKPKNSTIDRLKTMSKNSRGNLLRNNLRILKYGVIGYGRNIWLSITSTFVMTLTLILLFVTVIANIILSTTADRMRDKIDITIFFKPGTEVVALQEMTDIIKKDSNVKSAEYSTSDQEYKKVIEDTKKTGDAALLATLNDEDMNMILENQYIGDKEVAEALNVTTNTLAKWRMKSSSGPKFVFVKIGRSIMYRRDAIEKWLRENDRIDTRAT